MATRLGHWGNREMFLGANWSLIYKLKLHDESVSWCSGLLMTELCGRGSYRA